MAEIDLMFIGYGARNRPKATADKRTSQWITANKGATHCTNACAYTTAGKGALACAIAAGSQAGN